MNEKPRKLKSKACTAKRTKTLATIVTHFFETIWAVGTSVAAAMAISTSVHAEGRKLRPSFVL